MASLGLTSWRPCLRFFPLLQMCSQHEGSQIGECGHSMALERGWLASLPQPDSASSFSADLRPDSGLGTGGWHVPEVPPPGQCSHSQSRARARGLRGHSRYTRPAGGSRGRSLGGQANFTRRGGPQQEAEAEPHWLLTHGGVIQSSQSKAPERDLHARLCSRSLSPHWHI